ncbi:RNA-binding protein MEX3B isoform X2 [Gouania willdenowi]|uniref:RNA-binding protein MEX3B isoform X2 n=1 Tax=Gouania willdenowi TaxID=441366 RepID=UPI00105586F2|nr:RNA-binding E3 ubiquitin-protein ligase MEX3C isoform X2 [Gouania willdenowi]
MPSSTSLLDADEGESEVPLLHAFTGMGLEEPRAAHDRSPGEPSESLSFPLHSHQLTPVSHYSLLGTVLDLKPLSRPSSADGVIKTGSPVDAKPEAGASEAADGGGLLLAPIHRRPLQPSGPLRSGIPTGLEPPHVEAMLLFSGDERDEPPVRSGLPSANGMALLPAAVYGDPGYEAEPSLLSRRKSVNTTECVAVPSSEHVAEIVGRQGCKIKALRGKTNTYIKTPVRGEQPVFVVTGRKEDVAMAKREILSAAEHFSLIRASRNKTGPLSAVSGAGAPVLPGQTTIQVRVPYRVVGLVVGPKGATIKRIQQQTHTYIVTPSRDKEPVFEVTGMPENVDRAREEIEAHIALRTGSCGGIEAPGVDNNDFQFNGTDVSFEHGSRPGGGVADAAWLHSAASSPGGTSLLPMSANGVQRLNSNSNGGGVKMSSSFRNDSSSSLGSGSSSTDSFYGGNGNQGSDYSPTCLFNANINNNNNSSSSHGNGSGGAGFWFGDTLLHVGSEELLSLGGGAPPSGFDPLTISTAQAPPTHIWSPYMDNQPPHAVEGPHSQPTRNSSSLSDLPPP